MSRATKHLKKQLVYILGRRPDEFGLVTDADGYVKIKDLLRVLHEETDLKFVRQVNLKEIIYNESEPGIEIKDKYIRAIDRPVLLDHNPISANELPKLLYTCVRNKAHQHVLKKGITSGRSARVILTRNPEMALRMGKRWSSQPVLLTVQVNKALQNKVVFYQSGHLILTDAVPLGCFSAPPLKVRPEENKPRPEEAPAEKTKQRQTRRKEIERTKTRRQQRKEKGKFLYE